MGRESVRDSLQQRLMSSHALRTATFVLVERAMDFASFDLRNRMMSLRRGAEGWAPIRVTEMAAAALAKRTARPSD
jgi:hypothetical protein